MALREPGSTVVRGNENRIRAEILAGIADADANQLEAAQARFEQLLSEAANNVELRQELAQIYQWRGWLDRSLEAYRQVLTNDDKLLAARVGYVNAQIDAREYGEVDASLAEMTSVYERASHLLGKRSNLLSADSIIYLYWISFAG